jgi:hypothetical protein
VEALPDLATLSDDDLDRMIRALKEEEESISLRRRFLHGQIDLLRNERNARLREQISSDSPEIPDAGAIAATVVHNEEPAVPDVALGVESEIEPLPDLATVTTEELRLLIRELDREEDRISLERRLLHGRIDILSAERLLRAHAATDAEPEHVDVERLKEILSKRLVARRSDEAT